MLYDQNEGAAHDQFGGVLSLYKSTLAVSAVGASTAQMNGGAVYLYTRGFVDEDRTASQLNSTDAAAAAAAAASAAAWNLHTVLQPEDLCANAAFGHALAFDEDVGLVSAYNAQGSGVVYVFELVPSASRATSTSPAASAISTTSSVSSSTQSSLRRRDLRSNEVKQFVNVWEMKTILLPADPENELNMFGTLKR